MNAVTVIEAAPPSTQTAWLDRGRALMTTRREVDWQLADWMAEGKAAGHLCQTKFDFLGENLGLAPKRLKDALKAATMFPPALRDSSLSVEHHAALASLPKDDALPLLKRAAREHLSVNECREVVTQHRYNTGQRFDDEDTDTTLATLMRRAWNRGTREARKEAFEDFKIAAANGFGIIDEDETRDED